MAEQGVKDDGWWPAPLKHIPARDFLRNDMVVVAEISNGEQAESTRNFYMVLAEREVAEALLAERPPSFSYCPETGLYLSPQRSGIERLVTRSRGGANHTTQMLAESFIREYELVPRQVGGDDVVLHWDDLARPLNDVAIAEMVTVYDYPTTQKAQVRIRTDYLLDYADRTNRAILAFCYEWNDVPRNDGHTEGEFGEFKLPGRTVAFGPVHNNNERLYAEFWGILPVNSPKRGFRYPSMDLPPLTWPGIPKSVRRESASRLGMALVHVRDAVLDKFEKQPEVYTVHPDTGGVSYTHQWSVSYCHRVGRDLIALEIKKLYEGNPDDIIRHWHSHAVADAPMPGRDEPNVGSRSRRIVFGLAELGETLADLFMEARIAPPSGDELVGLDKQKLEAHWWYDNEIIRPITRRIPLDMGLDPFLNRCVDLRKLIIEGFDEKLLRQLLLALGVAGEEIGIPGSLKLLNRLLQLVAIANDTGLDIVDEFTSIEKRYLERVAPLEKGEHLPSDIAELFTLNDLRHKAAHRGRDVETKVLRLLKVPKGAVASGWGEQLDKVYDRVGDALENATKTLATYLSEFALRGDS